MKQIGKISTFVFTIFCHLVLMVGSVQAAPRQVRVGIIGAGNAGAAAAYYLSQVELDQIEFSVQIFEANDRVSGRSLSKQIELSDGQRVTINTGTQMNFREFLNVFPEELKNEIRDQFAPTVQNISVVSNSTNGEIRVHTLPRITDPNNVDEIAHKSGQVEATGILNKSELALGAVASANIQERFLNQVPFDDLVSYLNTRGFERIDQISAYDFLSQLSFRLQPTVTATNPLSWWKIAPKVFSYAAGSEEDKIRLGKEALVNLLYSQGHRQAQFSTSYIARMIESLEKIVEFSDLKSMSALNFLWQMKWVVEGGPIISPTNGWDRVAEVLLKTTPSQNIHLQHQVQSIIDNADGSHTLVIQKPDGSILRETVDIVINTADTDTALKMSEQISPQLKRMLEANRYSSTIAVHIETDLPIGRILGGATPALSAESGLLQKIGGMTFQTGMTGQPSHGKEVIGIFLQTEAAQEIFQKAQALQWTQDQIQEEARQIILTDLKTLSSKIERTNPAARTRNSIGQIAQSIENGRIVSVVSWKKALPLFQTGYVQLVQAYRNELLRGMNSTLQQRTPPPTNIYSGQAVEGRSIAMVIPGMKRLIAQLAHTISAQPDLFTRTSQGLLCHQIL